MLPPMRIVPDVTVSRPAIMRSVVDFPQPDGPSRIMNSPSRMSSDTLRTAATPVAYALLTFSRTIAAIVVRQPSDRM